MTNRILFTFLTIDFLFLCSGGLILAVCFIFKDGLRVGTMPTDVAAHLLLQETPLTAALINAIIIFITFFVSVAGVYLQNKRYLLQIHSWLILSCAIVTLVLGLDIWFSTLKTRANLGVLWSQQTPAMQTALQQKWNCCGYFSSTSPPFQTDATCPNPTVAFQLGGCMAPFSSFANSFLDIVFTAMFGIVALDGFLFLSSAVLLKDRAQRERYRLIDRKSGFGGI